MVAWQPACSWENIPIRSVLLWQRAVFILLALLCVLIPVLFAWALRPPSARKPAESCQPPARRRLHHRRRGHARTVATITLPQDASGTANFWLATLATCRRLSPSLYGLKLTCGRSRGPRLPLPRRLPRGGCPIYAGAVNGRLPSERSNGGTATTRGSST